MTDNTGSLPAVTCVVLSYNQQSYIEGAVKSALAQDYPNLRIIVSDDCSPDSTFDLASALVNEYQGPHKVEGRQNPTNLGLTEHLNTLMAMVDSELVVMAAGDDISLPNRVSTIVDAYLSHGKPMLLSSMAYKIDKEGNRLPGLAPDQVIPVSDLLAVSASLNHVGGRVGLYLGASGAWRMELWQKYGPIQYRHCWEDVVMGFRAALENSYFHIDEPLVEYRVDIGLSTSSSQTISAIFRTRKSRIALKGDLARQRYADLEKSAAASSSLREEVCAQIDLYSRLSAVYTSFSSFCKSLVCHPVKYGIVSLNESLFYLRSAINLLRSKFK